MKKLELFIIIILLEYILSIDCDYSDISKLITECYNNSRSIFHYWNKDCNNTKNIQIPSPAKSSNCNIHCEDNEFIDYDEVKNELTCNKCNYGTYSISETTCITWNEQTLLKFINNCYSNINDEIIKGRCDVFKINKGKNYTSIIAGGENLHKDAMNSYELIYYAELKNKGKITFTYRKNTQIDNKFHNGQFNFYIDFDLKLHDDDIENNKIKTFSMDLDPGIHSFYWQYNVWYSEENKLIAEIINIEIEGTKSENYKCLPCDDNIPYCNECPTDYFKSESGICEKCSEDEYSLSSVGKSSCNKKPFCNEDFQDEIKSPICNSGEGFIKVKLRDDLSCIGKENFIERVENITCDKCDNGYYMSEADNKINICIPCIKEDDNLSCISCDKNSIPYNIINIDPKSINSTIFDENYCVDLLSEKRNIYCPGWIIKNTGIFNYINKADRNVEKILKKQFEISDSESYLELNMTINHLSESENLTIYINNKIETFSSINEKLIVLRKYELTQGINKIEFHYSTISSVNDSHVIINKIFIKGSQTGVIGGCTECPKNSIKLKIKDNSICKPCQRGYIADKLIGICKECTDKDDIPECIKCPDFTTSMGSSCNLNEIIHNQELLIKYDITNMKSNIKNYCLNDNELCEGKFYGPLKDYVSKNIFFFSFADQSKFIVPDFSYKKEINYTDTGHVFALLNINDNNNVKLLKNVGKTIEYVKIIPYDGDKSFLNKTGLIISYSNGEYCDNNNQYKTILVSYCNKEQKNDKPKFIKQIDCTFIFEWNTYDVCPFCTKKDIKPVYTTCRNNKRFELYSEEPYCKIISEKSNINAIGYTNINNSKDNVLSISFIKKDKILKQIFNISDNTEDESPYTHLFENKNHIKISLKDEDIYLNKGIRIEVECSFIDNLDSAYIILAVIVPLVYFCTSIFLIVIYCKYKRVRDNYQRLRDEIDHNSIDPNQEDGNDNNAVTLDMNNNIN